MSTITTFIKNENVKYDVHHLLEYPQINNRMNIRNMYSSYNYYLNCEFDEFLNNISRFHLKNSEILTEFDDKCVLLKQTL